MSFETFVNTLAVAFVKHEFMQDEIRAAGLSFERMPEQFVGRTVALAYLDKLKSMTHARALFDLERDVAILEKFSDPIGTIPRNPEVLRDLFQEHSEQHEFKVLGDKLRLDPSSGKNLLRQFSLSEATAVEHQTLAELSLMVDRHHSEGVQKKSVVSIKGFEKLSAMMGGFNPGRLGILLGGTGFGKTNAAVNLALRAAETMRVGFANMEMNFSDMVKRIAVIASKVSYKDYYTGNFDKEKVSEALREHGGNVHLTSGRALSYDQISAWARLLSQRSGLNLLIVDYDQKVDLNLKHQTEEWKALQKLIEAFEDLAKELNLYCLVLAQVNRDGLISGSHRAMFPAHTVLSFYEHESFGAIIEAKKNRHGRKNQALTVIYDETNSHIIEGDVITLSSKSEHHKLTAKPVKPPAWRR